MITKDSFSGTKGPTNATMLDEYVIIFPTVENQWKLMIVTWWFILQTHILILHSISIF